MKKNLAVLTVLMAATLAAAQTSSAGSKSQSDAQSSSGQAGTQAQGAGASHLPQAKSKEEFDAYQAAAAEADPAKLEAAADAFAQKFPNSDLKALLYERDMALYQHANNADKLIEVGRKAIALDPNNPVPLVNVASALAETTRDSDLDHDQRAAEAAKDANAAIANIDTGLQVPPGTPPERVAQVKASILSMAYETLGVVDSNKKDFAAAETDFQKAIDANKNQPEPGAYLRLSVTQDNLKKYPQALESANKAVQYSSEGSAEQNLAKQQQARVQKLMAAQGGSATSGGATTPGATAPGAATPGNAQPGTPGTPGASTAQGTTPPPQPH